MNKDNDSIDFIKAISDKTRFKILSYLKKESCVTDIWQKLDISQNLTSFHLKVLKESGLINCKKQGLKVIYCLNSKKIKEEILSLEKRLI